MGFFQELKRIISKNIKEEGLGRWFIYPSIIVIFIVIWAIQTVELIIELIKSIW